MKGVRILIIASWPYNDALIQSHTLPYLKIMHNINPSSKIYLVTQEKDENILKRETKEKVDTFLSAFNIEFVPQKYHRFGLIKLVASVFQFLQLWWLVVIKGITHIHCFCTPAGAVGYLLAVLTGRQLVIDSYEPHAESMLENGTWKENGMAFRLLWWFEKAQTKRANIHIPIASGMDNYAREKYGVSLKHHFIKPSCLDLGMFKYNSDDYTALRAKLGWDDKIVCVYAGKFGGIYLEQEVFDFFREAKNYWGDRFRVLLLSTLTSEEVAEYCNKSKVSQKIFFVEKVPFSLMPKFLSSGDFGITPVKPVPSKRYCSPIKDGEYWAMGLPVVITANISDDSSIIEKHSAGAVLKELSIDEYKRAIAIIDRLLKEDRSGLRNRIRELAQTYRSYDIAKEVYNEIYGIRS